MPTFASPTDLQSMFEIDLEITPLVGAADIEAQYMIEDEFVGYAQLTYRFRDNQLVWKMFYPYGTPFPRQRYGLGTLAHSMTLLAVADEFSIPKDAVVTHHLKISRDRRSHLLAMGIDHCEDLRFDEYVTRSLAFARRKGFRLDG